MVLCPLQLPGPYCKLSSFFISWTSTEKVKISFYSNDMADTCCICSLCICGREFQHVCSFIPPPPKCMITHWCQLPLGSYHLNGLIISVDYHRYISFRWSDWKGSADGETSRPVILRLCVWNDKDFDPGLG